MKQNEEKEVMGKRKEKEGRGEERRVWAGLAFTIREGIKVMLPEEGSRIEG